MAFTFGAEARAAVPGMGTVLATNAAISIAAGDLIVCCVSWEVTNTTIVSVTDGAGNDLTIESRVDDGNQFHAVCHKLSAIANASAIFTFTLLADGEYRNIVVETFHPTAGTTVVKDTGTNPSPNTGSGTALESGNVTTTGSDEVCIGTGKWWTNGALTNPKIGGVAADGVTWSGDEYSSFSALWYKIGATGTIKAELTIPSAAWTASIIAFKAQEGGGMLGYEILKSDNPQLAMRRAGR